MNGDEVRRLWAAIRQDQIDMANNIREALTRREDTRRSVVNFFPGWIRRKRERIDVLIYFKDKILENSQKTGFIKTIGYTIAATGNLLSFGALSVVAPAVLSLGGGALNVVVEGLKINKETSDGEIIEALIKDDVEDTKRFLELLGIFYSNNNAVATLFEQFKLNSCMTPLFKISKEALEENLDLVRNVFNQFPHLFHERRLVQLLNEMNLIFPYVLEKVTTCLNFIGHYFNYDTATGVMNIALGALTLSGVLSANVCKQANAVALGFNFVGLIKSIDQFSDVPSSVWNLESVVRILEGEVQTFSRAVEEPDYEEHAQRMGRVPDILMEMAAGYDNPDNLMRIRNILLDNLN